MLTFFSTPKPFHGYTEVIQRNALRSWQRLDPDVEILLFGDEVGAADISNVRRNHIRECIDFGKRDWQSQIRDLAERTNRQHPLHEP